MATEAVLATRARVTVSRKTLLFSGLGLGLVVVALVAACSGQLSIPPAEVWSSLVGRFGAHTAPV
ncbi:hypothetical protein ACC691_36085, partial [Rhizobium johnstonii]|uniref:hypothetical protein n=1 Tax=Rhizobium johnstonii TaxID=3019933 RepID=UPI003F9BC417